MQPQTIMFFGPLGSGKGTQIKLLMDYFKTKSGIDSVHAGTGDGFRNLIKSDNFAANIVKEKMAKGELIDDFLANSIVADLLISSLVPEKNLFTDGYPRTIAQSKVFEGMMEFFKRDSVKIIFIELSVEESMKRNLLRGRNDDTKETILRRIEEEKKNIIPAMNYFKDKANYKIYKINGEQSVENVHKDIIKALGY